MKGLRDWSSIGFMMFFWCTILLGWTIWWHPIRLMTIPDHDWNNNTSDRGTFWPWHILWHICFVWLNFKQTRLIYSELATSLVQMTSFSVGELRIVIHAHTHDNSIDFWLLLKFWSTLCHDLHTWKIATHSSNSEATWNLTVHTNTQEDSFTMGPTYLHTSGYHYFLKATTTGSEVICFKSCFHDCGDAAKTTATYPKYWNIH